MNRADRRQRQDSQRPGVMNNSRTSGVAAKAVTLLGDAKAATAR